MLTLENSWSVSSSQVCSLKPATLTIPTWFKVLGMVYSTTIGNWKLYVGICATNV